MKLIKIIHSFLEIDNEKYSKTEKTFLTFSLAVLLFGFFTLIYMLYLSYFKLINLIENGRWITNFDYLYNRVFLLGVIPVIFICLLCWSLWEGIIFEDGKIFIKIIMSCFLTMYMFYFLKPLIYDVLTDLVNYGLI